MTQATRSRAPNLRAFVAKGSAAAVFAPPPWESQSCITSQSKVVKMYSDTAAALREVLITNMLMHAVRYLFPGREYGCPILKVETLAPCANSHESDRSPTIVLTVPRAICTLRDYVECPSCRQAVVQILRNANLPELTAEDVLCEVGEDLQALHVIGLVHCDVKVDNILLFPCPKLGVRAVLGDFTHTIACDTTGHAPWARCEQQQTSFIRDPTNRITQRSDWYGLAVSVVTATLGPRSLRDYGRSSMTAETRTSLLQQHVADAHDRFSDDLERVLQCMLDPGLPNDPLPLLARLTKSKVCHRLTSTLHGRSPLPSLSPHADRLWKRAHLQLTTPRESFVGPVLPIVPDQEYVHQEDKAWNWRYCIPSSQKFALRDVWGLFLLGLVPTRLSLPVYEHAGDVDAMDDTALAGVSLLEWVSE